MRSDRKISDHVRWRWLIGETLVVVIGVLIAIGINEAWSYRQDRNLELDYVQRIHSEILRDIEYVDGFSRDQVSLKMDALDTIGPVARGFRPVPKDIKTFLHNVSLGAIGGVSPTYHVRRSTFEDLVSTGNLMLISDAGLRSDLVLYYQSYEIQFKRIVERLTDYPSYVHGLIPSEMRTDLTLEAMETFNTDRAIEKVLSDEFQSLLNQEYNLGLFMRLQQSAFLVTAAEFRQKLEAHIAQLESN